MRIVAELACGCPEQHRARREAVLPDSLLRASGDEARLGYVRAARQETAAGAVRDWLSGSSCGARRLVATVRLVELAEGGDFAGQLARELTA